VGEIILHPKDDERQPDDAEADQVGAVEGFLIDEDADQELQGRRDVLQNAHHREGNLLGGGSEHEQRDGGDDPRARQQQVNGHAIVQEGACPVGFDHEQVDQRGRENHRGLEGESIERAERRDLFDESINAEREGQRERDPRQAAVDEGQIENTDRGDDDGHPLCKAQSLAQEDDAQQHAQKRINEVAETGLHDEARVDSPHVNEPVNGKQHARQGIRPDGFGMKGRGAKILPLFGEQNK